MFNKSVSSMDPLVALLFILLGLSSWISVSGVWVELPLMVSLPEGWALPSYISLINQIANVGPLSYILLKHFKCIIKVSSFIYIVLSLGSLATFLLIFFWDTTYVIGNKAHSLSLFMLVFIIALVDCTSSILYLLYMSQWKSCYLPMYFVGEGLSGSLPAILAIFQGIGTEHQDSKEVNSCLASKEGTRFPPSQFFIFIFLMMSISLISFIILQVYSKCQIERESHKPLDIIDDEIKLLSDTHEDNGNIDEFSTNHDTEPNKKIRTLLIIQTYISLIMYGFLPSIQTYSICPYGASAYHWAVIYYAIFDPFAAAATSFLPCRLNIRLILLVTGFGSVIAFYLTATATMSIHPLSTGKFYGTVFLPLCWGVCSVVVTFARVEINNVLRLFKREDSENIMLWSGGCTQLGSFTGSLIAFILVNTTNIFVK